MRYSFDFLVPSDGGERAALQCCNLIAVESQGQCRILGKAVGA